MKYKCQIGGFEFCDTCKWDSVRVGEEKPCSICLKNKCPLEDEQGSCEGCPWEAADES